MGNDRQVWLTDRWGASVEEDVTTERFAPLFDDLDPDDASYAVVSIQDSDDLFLEFSRTEVSFGDVESGDARSLVFADRVEALEIAAEFLAGDLDAMNRRAWVTP